VEAFLDERKRGGERVIDFVPDASALHAALLGEPGGVRVGHALMDSAMVAVNFAEVVGHHARYGGRDAKIRAVLDPLPIASAPLDHELATKPACCCR
jgi:PIN domain nuclease of toxin-antitoxin system